MAAQEKMGEIYFGCTSAPVGSPPAPHPGVPGKNPWEAHGTCSPGAAGPGIPFQCFQQNSFLQETSVFCTSTRGQPVTELPESLLATCALLLHTLSPLCDHGQGQKGSTRMQCDRSPRGAAPCSDQSPLSSGRSSPGGAGVQAARGLANGGARGGRRFVLRQNRLRTKL